MPELDIQGILERLATAAVDYIVIGGVAVGFHGYVRATKDLDVVPAPGRQNLERLVATELPDPLDPDTLALGGNWVLQTRLGRFDVMQWLGERELWEMLVVGQFESRVSNQPNKSSRCTYRVPIEARKAILG